MHISAKIFVRPNKKFDYHIKYQVGLNYLGYPLTIEPINKYKNKE